MGPTAGLGLPAIARPASRDSLNPDPLIRSRGDVKSGVRRLWWRCRVGGVADSVGLERWGARAGSFGLVAGSGSRAGPAPAADPAPGGGGGGRRRRGGAGCGLARWGG